MPGMEQDEIDKLLADALGDVAADESELPLPQEEGEQAEAPAPVEEAPPPDEPDEAPNAVQTQDDIDALLAEMGGASEPEVPQAQAAEEEHPPPEPEPEDQPAAAEAGESEGIQNQDDIDALLSSMAGDSGDDGGSDEPEADTPAPEADEPPQPSDQSVSQDELEALIEQDSSTPQDTPATEEPEPEPAPEPEAADAAEETMGKTGGTEERLAQELAPVEAEAARAIFDEEVIAPEPEDPADEPIAELNQSAVTHVMPSPIQEEEPAAQAADEPPREPLPASEPATPPAPPIQPAAPSVPPLQDVKSIQESLSLMTSAGEVEGIAGQIASLLGQLSERARRYQNAWLGTDQEAKELRTRLAGAEHRQSVFEEEKKALQEEVDALRARLSRIEGEKLAGEESSRTQIASLELKLREQISRADMLQSEVQSLKEELNHARNESTGADLESRRARFELDRLRSELDSERMERMRLQRALDNREKELQTIQAQTAGQASSLFLDELHRLVRRLENEMDIRTSAAHEALAVLDRMKIPDEMVAMGSNLRTALLTASGLNAGESEDALRSLTETAHKPGDAATPIKPYDGRATLASFESALVSLNLDAATDLARELLRETYTTPSHLMGKIYLCPALRTPEVGKHLTGVIKLLQNLKETQDAANRTLGREGPDTERMMVQMFDYLHNLVRLRHISRTTAEAWQFFLELRGRYSFVTSDKQWAEYRDRVLSGA